MLMKRNVYLLSKNQMKFKAKIIKPKMKIIY